MLKLFRRGGGSGEGQVPERIRPSRGWADVLAHLKTEPARSLRVLDFGTTSPVNINLLTSLGHSVYMANIVGDAQKPEWVTSSADGTKGKAVSYDTDRFKATNLDFSGRDFDIVLLWDTADYLPVPLVPALIERLREVTRREGRLLGFFHTKADGPNVVYSRYQLTETSDLKIIGSEPLPVRQTLQNRQIEKYLEGFGTVRFFQGTDNVREVLAIR